MPVRRYVVTNYVKSVLIMIRYAARPLQQALHTMNTLYQTRLYAVHLIAVAVLMTTALLDAAAPVNWTRSHLMFGVGIDVVKLNIDSVLLLAADAVKTQTVIQHVVKMHVKSATKKAKCAVQGQQYLELNAVTLLEGVV